MSSAIWGAPLCPSSEEPLVRAARHPVQVRHMAQAKRVGLEILLPWSKGEEVASRKEGRGRHLDFPPLR